LKDKKTIYYATLVIIVIFFACAKKSIDTHEPITQKQASELLNQYINALVKGDSSDVLSFWSLRSSHRPDFWNMHAFIGHRIPFSEWPDFLGQFEPKIIGIRSEKEYDVIDLSWTLRDSTSLENSQSKEMRFYIVQENDRWNFINPIDVLTKDWKSYESDYLVFHFPKETKAEEYIHEIEAGDHSFKEILRFFQIEMTGKIHFYKVRTSFECGELILHPPAYGYAVLPPKEVMNHPFDAYKIISTSFYHPHEVTHCLTAIAGIPYDNHIISEGFAVALGGVAGATADLTLIKAKNLLEASKLLHLKTLFTIPTPEFMQKNYITYYESGALIRFLHDQFGMERLRQFSVHITHSANLGKSLKEIFNVSLSNVENQFHKYLLNRKRKNIGFTISAKATNVFTMADPENDDIGDGDYVYPRHSNFEKGVFDLRQFDVLRDSENAYFRVTLSKLMTPVSYGSSDEQFTPCIVIAINKGKEKGMPQHHDCHGVQFAQEEGYDIKLNIGSAVSLSNYLGKVYYTTQNIVYEFVNKEENTIEVSVPIDMIGEPEEDWKYFVGVGLTSSRTMNFLYGGPMPVWQNHPAFISGGNFPYGNPDFIDILCPHSIEQVQVLSKYDMTKNIKPIVRMIGR